MTKFKKLLSVLIAVLVLISALPVAAVSAAGEYQLSLSEPYVMDLDEEGEKVKFVPDKTGWYAFYTTGNLDTYASLYSYLGTELEYSDDTDAGLNFHLKCMLTAGYTYYLEVGLYTFSGGNGQATLYVEESVGAESVLVTKAPDSPTVVEGYEYDTVDLSGLEATFTLSDGTEVDWTYNEDNYVNGSYVSTEIDSDFLTNKFYVEISCDSANTRYYLTTIENPVDHIEYSGSSIDIFENSSCYYDTDVEYNIYDYYLPEDANITVYYTDGSQETGYVYDEFSNGYTDYYDNQYETPWTIDGNNSVIISYLGAETEIPVNILPCPFKSVTLNSAPTREYIYGDSMWGFLYEDEWFGDSYYYLYPEDITGISFTVEYEDGTTQTYTDKDFDTTNYLLDGYEYSIDSVYAESTGTYEAIINYKGYDLAYDIEIIESPVASIEILSDPYVTEYDGFYYPVFDGMELNLNYNDGTSDTVILSDENTTYLCEGFLTYEFTVGDNTVYANYAYDEEELGEYYTFSCLGTETAYTGCTFDYEKEINTITAENLTKDVDGAVVNIEYADDTQEQITLDVLAYSTYEDDFTEGAAMTENGIVYYTLEKTSDSIYLFYLLGETIEFDAEPLDVSILGDANEDGSVNIKDATLIQKHIAGLEPIPEAVLILADTDLNEDVNIKDATAIQKHIAGIDTGYPIGTTYTF